MQEASDALSELQYKQLYLILIVGVFSNDVGLGSSLRLIKFALKYTYQRKFSTALCESRRVGASCQNQARRLSQVLIPLHS